MTLLSARPGLYFPRRRPFLAHMHAHVYCRMVHVYMGPSMDPSPHAQATPGAYPSAARFEGEKIEYI
jgi:hypothetical protein